MSARRHFHRECLWGGPASSEPEALSFGFMALRTLGQLLAGRRCWSQDRGHRFVRPSLVDVSSRGFGSADQAQSSLSPGRPTPAKAETVAGLVTSARRDSGARVRWLARSNGPGHRAKPSAAIDPASPRRRLATWAIGQVRRVQATGVGALNVLGTPSKDCHAG